MDSTEKKVEQICMSDYMNKNLETPSSYFWMQRETVKSYKKKDFKLQVGDKFTKKPLQCGRHLVCLGRQHIHALDLKTLETKMLKSVGED